MRSAFFVSISILLVASIDLGASQFAFLQPKSIRDGALYHQEVFYGGVNQQGVIQHAQNTQNAQIIQPIFGPRIQVASEPLKNAPVTSSTTTRPVSTTFSTTTTTTEQEFENTPRTLNRILVPTSTAESIIVRKLQKDENIPVTSQRPPTTTTEAPTDEELEEQAKSAHYNFGTSVRDTINDHEHTRQEVREGLTLKGMYSYSDGFFRRTVHYEADQGGYRVVKELVEPLNQAEGPQFNPEGQAEVKSTLAGDYSITVDDFKLNKQQEQIIKDRVVRS